MEPTEISEIVSGIIEAVVDSGKTVEVTDMSIKSELLSPESDLKSSESSVFYNPPEPSLQSKCSSSSKLGSSRIQSKTPSRPGSSQKESKSSVATHEMVLPHKLGQKPKYLMKINASNQEQIATCKIDFVRGNSFVVDSKSSKIRMDSQSGVSLSRPSTVKSRDSQASSTNLFQATKLPTMYKKPKSAKDDKKGVSRTISSAPTETSGDGESEFKPDQIEFMQSQVRAHSVKTLESKKKATELAKTIEQQRQKIAELEKQLEDKNKDLNLKSERIKSLGSSMKNQREKTDKMSSVETQLTDAKKVILEFQKDGEKKDETIQKMKAEMQKMKRELDSKTKTCETLQSEKKNLDQSLKAANKEKASGNEGQKRQVELQQMVQDLEIQLQSRVADLNKLKVEAESLAGENQSLKAQSFNEFKNESSEIQNLKRELSERKKAEQEIKQELLTLKSKLEDEQHKIYRNENLLQLRGEYIKTLQDTDEVNKARLILQAKDIEDLNSKLNKAKKFKAATQEERDNLFNKLKSQEFDILNLKREVEIKDAKIMKLKGKLTL